MPEYTIYYNTMASQPITVTADDLDQAIDAGYDLLSSGLCHQCAGHIDLGDWEADAKAAFEDYPEAVEQ